MSERHIVLQGELLSSFATAGGHCILTPQLSPSFIFPLYPSSCISATHFRPPWNWRDCKWLTYRYHTLMAIETSGKEGEGEGHGPWTKLEHPQLSDILFLTRWGRGLLSPINPCTLSACYHEKLDVLALDLVAFEGC